jgi:hypothetical protein
MDVNFNDIVQVRISHNAEYFKDRYQYQRGGLVVVLK